MKNNKDLYATKSDNELFNAAKKGDDPSLEALYNRFTRIGYQLAKIFFEKYSFNKELVDEFAPELDFAFLKTYRSFDPEKGSFYSFFAAILENTVLRFIKRVVFTNDLLRHCVSLDRTFNDIDSYECVEDKKDLSPKDYSIRRDVELEIASPAIGRNATIINLSKKILILKQYGFSTKDIAQQLGMSQRKVCLLLKEYSHVIYSLKIK